MLKFSVILTLFVFSSLSSFSQNYGKEFEILFAWQVKQIDEFIERYNFNNQTLLLKYTNEGNKSRKLNRESMLKSLFNSEGKNWNTTDITHFINQVNDPTEPIFINFFDPDWYAEVDCSVTWNGKPEKATFILKIQLEPDQSSKWVVAGIKAKFLKVPKSTNPISSLNPLSHATDFINIDQVSADKANMSNYLPRSYDYDLLSVSIYEILNKRLVVNRANAIAYHFLQIDGWIFKVQQFNRETTNAGWLISKLQKVSFEDKNRYRMELLGSKAIVKMPKNEKF